MTAATGAAGHQEIRKTVECALRPGPPPPYDELVAQEQRLLLLIADLWMVVDRCPLRGAENDQRKARMDAIRYQTAVGLGNGLVSAHRQVRALARDCLWLLDQHSTAPH
ncbi:DUF6415 family natural product biosynthesis protein [Streptomyces sp. NPDC020742]|uniref:DUF6415 family natural product biosynthesis protein n=1 Tax=unclassified Streptomyces TaxID=2593676 RepID=UPI0033D22154